QIEVGAHRLLETIGAVRRDGLGDYTYPVTFEDRVVEAVFKPLRDTRGDIRFLDQSLHPVTDKAIDRTADGFRDDCSRVGVFDHTARRPDCLGAQRRRLRCIADIGQLRSGTFVSSPSATW